MSLGFVVAIVTWALLLSDTKSPAWGFLLAVDLGLGFWCLGEGIVRYGL